MRRLFHGLTAVVGLLLIAVAVPWFLIEVAGWPLPTKLPNWSNVYWSARQNHVPSEFVVASIAIVAWLAWAQLMWAVLWELAVNVPRTLRGQRTVAAPWSLGVMSRVARGLVAPVMLLTTFVASTPTVAAPALADLSSSRWLGSSPYATAAAVVDLNAITATAPVWVVESGDSLWDVAERCLGDGSRVDEILACNPGLAPTSRLRIGESLTLPPDAFVPANRTPQPAAPSDTAAVDAGDVPAHVGDTFGAPWGAPGDPAGTAAPADTAAVDAGDVPAPVGDTFGDAPLGAPVDPAGTAEAADVHLVEPGDTLWDIADEEFGDPLRWPEVFEANEGRTFPDGRTLSDPARIHPGWDLAIPTDAPPSDPASEVTTGSTEAPSDTVADPAADPVGSGPVSEVGAVPADAASELVAGSVGEPVGSGPVGAVPVDVASDVVADVAADPVGSSPVGEVGEVGAVPVDVASDVVADVAADPVGSSPDSEEVAVPVDAASDVVAGPVEPAEPALAAEVVVEPVDSVPDLVTDAVVEPDETTADVTVDTSTVDTSTVDTSTDAAAPVNRWSDVAVPGGAALDPPATAPGATAAAAQDGSVDLLTMERAAMMSAGVLLLLAVRRRQRLRGAPPGARPPVAQPTTAATERALRSVGAGERFARVDLAVRASALQMIRYGRRPVAVVVAPDGSIELTASGPLDLGAPWEGSGAAWTLPASVPIELLAPEARRVAAPTPALVQLGCDDGREVYVDLEALGALQIDAPPPQADAVVAALATTLATSVLAEVTTLVGVGVPDAAFCGHRHHLVATDLADALAAAVDAVGSTVVAPAPTFELRARATGGETWEPAVVLVGSVAGEAPLPFVPAGVAVVSAAPIVGPSSVLAPDGEAWILRPAGIRLTPVGLTAEDLHAVADLLDVPEPVPPDPLEELAAAAAPTAAHDLLVRLIGPVRVETAAGIPVEFDRSKTRELIAWLATHRERSTRTMARTALWEFDVRDATFANVVSEARRAMARAVAPPEGEEWVGRTLTEELPLHELVRTDAEVITAALAAARLAPPAEAIAVLRPAVDLLAGMPFEGTSYLWPDPEGITSSLIVLATTAAAELGAQCLAVGDVEGVFGATERGLRVLPGHEELIGLRMRAHARAGDHAGVRQEWESYSRTLVADPWSDGEPSPKLVRLRADLLGTPSDSNQ